MSRQARDAPAAANQRDPLSLGRVNAAVVVEVVVTLSVEVCAVAPLRVTEVGERVHVAGWLAAVGVTAQVRATAPLNPPDPVALMVAVLPVVAPALTVMLPLLLSAKLGEAAETVTVTAAEVLVLKLVSPL